MVREARVGKEKFLRPIEDFGMVRVLENVLRGEGGREAIGEVVDLQENGLGIVDDRREDGDEKAMTNK